MLNRNKKDTTYMCQSGEKKGSNSAMVSKVQLKWGWHSACIVELWGGTKNLVLQ